MVQFESKLGLTTWQVQEAKAWARPLTEGVAQAKQYAAKLAVRFAFSTNGQGVWSIDRESEANESVPVSL